MPASSKSSLSEDWGESSERGLSKGLEGGVEGSSTSSIWSSTTIGSAVFAFPDAVSTENVLSSFSAKFSFFFAVFFWFGLLGGFFCRHDEKFSSTKVQNVPRKKGRSL